MNMDAPINVNQTRIGSYVVKTVVRYDFIPPEIRKHKSFIARIALKKKHTLIFRSKKDQHILELIFLTIANYPDQLKYQTLNIKHLSTILDNPALVVNLLLKFGFNYLPNNVHLLKFFGVEIFLRYEKELFNLVREKKIDLALLQYVICACFLTDEEHIKKRFEWHESLGMFQQNRNNNQYVSWKDRTLLEKIETARIMKEVCQVQHIDDFLNICFIFNDHDKSGNNNGAKVFELYLFNNNGKQLNIIRRNEQNLNLNVIIDGFQKKWSPFLEQNSMKHFNTICSSIASTNDTKRLNFLKTFALCAHLCLMQCDKREDNPKNASDMSTWSTFQHDQIHYRELCSLFYKYEKLLNNVSKVYVDRVFTLQTSKNSSKTQGEDYIKTVVQPKARRLIRSKNICKYIKENLLCKNSNYVWRCLL